MAEVKYVGIFKEVELEYPVGRWVTVARGKTLDVDDDTAERLCEQEDNWKPVKAKPPADPPKDKPPHPEGTRDPAEKGGEG